jgi:hypothetical protein
MFRHHSAGLFWFVSTIGVILMAASVAGYAYSYFSGESYYIEFVARKLHIDAEQNLATWFSSSMMFTAGILAILVHKSQDREKPDTNSGWILLGALLIGMSIDESADFHEEIFDWLIPIFQVDFVHFWVIPALPIVLTILWFTTRFARRLPGQSRGWILYGFLVFFLGAVAVEAVGGLVAEAFTKASYLYMLCTHAEEFLEIVGLAMVNQGLYFQLGGIRWDRVGHAEGHGNPPAS